MRPALLLLLILAGCSPVITGELPGQVIIETERFNTQSAMDLAAARCRAQGASTAYLVMDTAGGWRSRSFTFRCR